jgi:hypothetical protein
MQGMGYLSSVEKSRKVAMIIDEGIGKWAWFSNLRTSIFVVCVIIVGDNYDQNKKP